MCFRDKKNIVLHSLPTRFSKTVKIKNNNMCVILTVSYFAYDKPSVAECFNSPLPHSRTTQLRGFEKICCFGTVKGIIKIGLLQNGPLRLHAHVHTRVTVEEVEIRMWQVVE